jgi:glycosyltransferase involved in cell wall biosynthesis
MISVLIATRNGARTLPAALERLRALRPAPVPHRVVIVDNASTDATPAILRA